MDYQNLYFEIKDSLEDFIKDYFEVEVEISPSSVNFVDKLEDNGYYDPSTDKLYVRKSDEYNTALTLAHELLHYVGFNSNDEILEPLSNDEYATELLSNAFIKYFEEKRRRLNQEIISIRLGENEYSKADSDAIGKNVDEIVDLYKESVEVISISLE